MRDKDIKLQHLLMLSRHYCKSLDTYERIMVIVKLVSERLHKHKYGKTITIQTMY